MIKRIHHVGVVVRGLEEALPFFRDVLGLPVARTALVRDQAVKAALVTVGDSEIELLEPLEPDSGIGRFLSRWGEGLHHFCFETEDVRTEVGVLKAKGVELIDQAPRRGLVGLICFLHPRALHGTLVELAQPLEDDDSEGVERLDVSGAVAADRRSSPLLLALDHVALAVRDLEEAARTWEATLGLKADAVFQPTGAGLRLARLPAGVAAADRDGAFVELVTPLAAEHRVTRFLDERGEGMFSISCRVERIEEAVAFLRGKGAAVSGVEPGVFEGTRLALVDRPSAHGVALQLIERS